MNITRISILSGIERTIDLPVTDEQIKLYCSADRPHIQDCFPNLSRDQREFILTGITQEEWDNEFGEEE